jgi:hypothetical protein
MPKLKKAAASTARGPFGIARLPGANSFELIKSDAQIQYLVARYGLAPATAARIASLAWEAVP